MKKRRYLLLGIPAGLILALIWARLVDWGQLTGYMRELKPGWVILSGVVYLLAYYIRALRWKVILSPGMHVSSRKSFAVLMAGNFLNYLIPVRAGEVAKCVMLKKIDNVPATRTLSSVFVDKLFDSLGIVFVLLLIPILSIHLSGPLSTLIVILCVVLLAGVLVLAMSAFARDHMLTLLQLCMRKLKPHTREKANRYFSVFLEGVGMFRDHMSLLPLIILLTLSAIVLDSLYFSLLFIAFGHPVDFTLILFGYTLIYLSFILPHPPAQIGSNELLAVLVFTVGLGINKDLVSAVMVFAHIYTGLIITATGLLGIGSVGWKAARGIDESMDKTIGADS